MKKLFWAQCKSKTKLVYVNKLLLLRELLGNFINSFSHLANILTWKEQLSGKQYDTKCMHRKRNKFVPFIT